MEYRGPKGTSGHKDVSACSCQEPTWCGAANAMWGEHFISASSGRWRQGFLQAQSKTLDLPSWLCLFSNSCALEDEKRICHELLIHHYIGQQNDCSGALKVSIREMAAWELLVGGRGNLPVFSPQQDIDFWLYSQCLFLSVTTLRQVSLR